MDIRKSDSLKLGETKSRIMYHTLNFYFITVFALVQAMSYGQTKQMEVTMPDIKLISAYDVEEKVDGKMARSSTVEIIFQPKGTSMPHRHPGPVYGYVLEGTFEFKVEGKPLRTLKPGNTFYEPRMALHEVGRNPSDSTITKVLAIVVHPRNAEQLVILEEPME